MTPLVFITCSLIVFRVALAVSKERGPYDVFQKLRTLPPKSSSWRRGLACPWCVSVYAATIVCIALTLLEFIYVWEALWWVPSLSAAAILINQQWTKGDDK